MKTLKTMGIIEIILIAFTLLCTFGGSDSETIGFWAIAALLFALAQSIVGIVQAGK